MRTLIFTALAFLFISVTNCGAQDLSRHTGFWGMQYFQDNEKVSKKDFLATLYQDPNAAALWQKSKQKMGVAWGFFGVQMGMLIWQFDRRNKGESQTLPLIGNLAAAGVSIGFAISASNAQRDAVITYNRGLKESTHIDFGMTHNGAGLVVSF